MSCILPRERRSALGVESGSALPAESDGRWLSLPAMDWLIGLLPPSGDYEHVTPPVLWSCEDNCVRVHLPFCATSTSKRKVFALYHSILGYDPWLVGIGTA